jgi:hypothetical protein
VTQKWITCPTCGADASHLEPYDIGSGPKLSCSNCEWCWGAEGQPLKALDLATVAGLSTLTFDPADQIAIQRIKSRLAPDHPEGESDW